MSAPRVWPIAACAVLIAGARGEPPGAPDLVPPPNAVVEQPRPFGYVVGDLLTQRVLLQLRGGAFEPAALPRAERINAWLERRPPRVEETPDARRWLVVEYQVINAPQALTLVRIPAWVLPDKSGANELRIGEWPVSVSPLTPPVALTKGGLDELRPDHPPPAVPTAPLRRQAMIAASALVATLALWLTWVLWRNWRAAVTQPFASALREMRQLDERAPEAWQILHRAFDRTAGRVVQMATLPSLFQRAPYLVPVREQIERFFLQSNERFFGAGLTGDALSVRQLCARLRRLEKSHER